MSRVKPKKRDWQGLERKLSGGKTLEQAATETGVPVEEALAWLEAKRAYAGFDDDSLRLAAAEALHHGLTTLVAASQDDKRIASEGLGEGRSISYATTDVDAAKELVRFALNARKMLAGKAVAKAVAEKEGIKDLFDFPQAVSNWTFKDVE